MQRVSASGRRLNRVCLWACSSLGIAFALPFAGAQNAAGSAQPQPAAQPVSITLEEAIHRAQVNEPTFATALADSRSAALDRSIARSALLPGVTYHNQYLYTEGTGFATSSVQGGAGSTAAPRFIANNAVHEYISQGLVDETIGLAQVAGVRHADAAAAVAAAELEISRRGLVAAVSGLYYSVISADNKLTIAEQARSEAADFTSLTGKREQQREAAHADVVKAQLQQQQRDRELSDARLAAEKARLELGVLLFPDPRTSYTVAASEPAQLPARGAVEQAAGNNNPELRSALAALNQSSADVLAARGAYFPSLGLNYTYGIDSPQFAIDGPADTNGSKLRNLGYSASVTLDIPVWDWLAMQHKVKQSEIRRDAAKVNLTNTQRRLIARLDEAWSEANAARDQLASLDASVSTAGESLRLTKMRYTGGEATVLEVVDAQTAYVASENAREDGRVRYQAALADLETLTGTM
jgi:outer membrane protein TolC